MRTYGYIRVSSKGQNEARQIEEMKKLGIDEKFIFLDKQSGKDFDRTQYQFLKRILAKGDLLVIEAIDRFGRNYKEITKEWRDITETIGADIKVLDMPLLNTTQYKDTLGNFVSDLVLQVLSYVADRERENIQKRQRQGIEVAKVKGVKFGRPEIDMPNNFEEVYNEWKDEKKKIKAVEAMKKLGMTKATFYRKVKEYEGRS